MAEFTCRYCGKPVDPGMRVCMVCDHERVNRSAWYYRYISNIAGAIVGLVFFGLGSLGMFYWLVGAWWTVPAGALLGATVGCLAHRQIGTIIEALVKVRAAQTTGWWWWD